MLLMAFCDNHKNNKGKSRVSKHNTRRKYRSYEKGKRKKSQKMGWKSRRGAGGEEEGRGRKRSDSAIQLSPSSRTQRRVVSRG